MVKNENLTDDIVQIAFIKLYENLGSIRNKSSIKYWLFKTARNEIYSGFRRNSTKHEVSGIDAEAFEFEASINIENELELKDMREILLMELDNLPPDQKEIFILREFSGLTYKEIASLFSVSIELVKSRLYKTRRKLVNRLSVMN